VASEALENKKLMKTRKSIHTLDFCVPYVHLRMLLRQLVGDGLLNPTRKTGTAA